MVKSRRLAQLGNYLRPHWKETLLGIIALLSVNGLGVYIPLLIRSGVATLSTTFSSKQISILCGSYYSAQFRHVDDAHGLPHLDFWCWPSGRI